jgi:hypothetical protein
MRRKRSHSFAESNVFDSREQATGGGHGSMGGMKVVSDALNGADGGDAEQMALFITYFAEL